MLSSFAKAGQSVRQVAIGQRLILFNNLVFLFFIVFLVCPHAQASVGVVLNESLDESMDRITGTGHTAVYFSNICADSPVKLRLCRPGEFGSVMSTYINIGENHPYEWNVVPLTIYLYGVEDPKNRLLFGSPQVKRLLEERYREKYLSQYCDTDACRTSKKSEWREMVAATMIRSIYIFAIDTTIEQDQRFIAEFNRLPNKNNFNGAIRNCADFTRVVINFYFPHAVYRDYLNDFGMESPKAVARTFTHYALHHPDSNFRVMHFAQVPGTIKRSSEVRSGTEQLYHSKKFLIPMVLFADRALPFVAMSYLITGRFNPEHTFEKYPTSGPDTAKSPAELQRVAPTPDDRTQLIGSPSDWKHYRKAFASTAQASEDSIDKHDLSRFLKNLDREGTATIDKNGSIWMDLWEDGEPLRVGLSASNALAVGSNAQLAYKFFLARTQSVLKSSKHSRETMLEFDQDWAMLQHVAIETDPDLRETAASAGKAAAAYR